LSRPFGRARSTAQPGQRNALVEIANPGSPIPPDELPRIFEQFYVTPDGEERGGTGLGLPIAREIARAHGGDVAVTSSPEATTFQVDLPTGRDVPVTPPPLTAVSVS
jgi:signal transduction histidine kinase